MVLEMFLNGIFLICKKGTSCGVKPRLYAVVTCLILAASARLNGTNPLTENLWGALPRHMRRPICLCECEGLKAVNCDHHQSRLSHA